MQIQLSYQMLLTLPFLIAGIAYGWRRGWREEALTTIALIFGLIVFSDRFAGIMGSLINRIVQAFALFFSALLGGGVEAPALVTDANIDTFRFLGFLVTVYLAYLVGSVLGARRNVGRGGKLLGALLGIVNVYLVATQIFSYISGFLPQVFQQQGQITLTPDPTATLLRSYLPTIFALLLIVFLIIVFLNLRKIRE